MQNIHQIIEDVGVSSPAARNSVQLVVEKHKARLGPITPVDFWVSLFKVEFDGLTFGLVKRPSEPEEDDKDSGPLVDLLPGSTLMFFHLGRRGVMTPNHCGETL